MEEACRDLPIDDYSISQNTLDNVRTALIHAMFDSSLLFYQQLLTLSPALLPVSYTHLTLPTNREV